MIKRWTIHPIIQEDEALSSWIKRLADAYAIPSLPNILNQESLRHIISDTIDRRPKDELINFLSMSTGISIEEIKKHILVSYDTHFPVWKGTKIEKNKGLEGSYTFAQNFVLSYRRPKKADGLRYCPICLKEEIPYFRFYWLLGYYTACIKHKTLLYSCCTNCHTPLNLLNVVTPLGTCHNCKTKLSEALPIFVDTEIIEILHSAFLEKKSPLPDISSQEFLGYIWTTYSRLMLLEKDYLEQLFSKYKFTITLIDIDITLLSHYCLQLVWKIIQLHPYKLDKLLPCVKCDQYFNDNTILLGHYKRHFEPTLECSICKEKFFEKFEYERHQSIHSEKNEFCPYCSAYFTKIIHISPHINKMHSEQLKKDVNTAIIQLKAQKQKVTYVNVANTLNISRTLLNSNKEILKLFQAENDLRVRFFKSIKLSEEEKKSKILEILLEAIHRIDKRNEEITQVSVAKEIGISRRIFFNNPKYKDIIEKYRTGKGGYNTEYLITQVDKAMVTLKQKEKTITYQNIAEEIGCDVETLTKRSEIRELIDPLRDMPKEKPTLEKVKNIIEELKKTSIILTKAIIQDRLECDYRTLQRDPQIFSYIEQEIEKQQKELKSTFENKLKEALDAKLNTNIDITFRGVAKELSIDAHRLLDDYSYKSLIECYIERLDDKKKQLILSTIHTMKEKQKEITYIEIHRRTKLPRSYIESDKIRQFIRENS